MKTQSFALLVVAVMATPSAADTLTKADGTVVSDVTVLSETYESVEYRVKDSRAKRSINAAEVRSIDYSRTNADYREGVAALVKGDTILAANLYVRAAEDKKIPAHVRASALVQAADILVAEGDSANAVSVYDQLIRDHSKTRHLARALLGKGKAALYSGDTTTALAAFETLILDAREKGFGEQWALEAEFMAVRSKHVIGTDLPTIQSAYQDLQNRAKTAGIQSIALGCSLRLARLHLDNDEPMAAFPMFNNIIKGRLESSREVAAEAFNGRGRCLVAMAEILRANDDEESAIDEYATARLDFLRVHVHYPDVQGQQAEALFWAAQCFENVQDTDAGRHAAILKKRLTSRFPESAWAKQVAR